MDSRSEKWHCIEASIYGIQHKIWCCIHIRFSEFLWVMQDISMYSIFSLVSFQYCVMILVEIPVIFLRLLLLYWFSSWWKLTPTLQPHVPCLLIFHKLVLFSKDILSFERSSHICSVPRNSFKIPFVWDVPYKLQPEKLNGAPVSDAICVGCNRTT